MASGDAVGKTRAMFNRLASMREADQRVRELREAATRAERLPDPIVEARGTPSGSRASGRTTGSA